MTMILTTAYTSVRISSQEAFEAALKEDPLDPMTHQVYADWLEERGDPTSEQLRKSTQAMEAADPTKDVLYPTTAHHQQYYEQLSKALAYGAAKIQHQYKLVLLPDVQISEGGEQDNDILIRATYYYQLHHPYEAPTDLNAAYEDDNTFTFHTFYFKAKMMPNGELTDLRHTMYQKMPMTWNQILHLLKNPDEDDVFAYAIRRVIDNHSQKQKRLPLWLRGKTGPELPSSFGR